MFEAEIAEGIKTLNQLDPGWPYYIDLDNLKMSTGERCILGQRGLLDHVWAHAGGWFSKWVQVNGFNLPIRETSAENYEILTDEWRVAIRKLRS